MATRNESTLSRAVLITGCSSGIGAATARRLVQRGWRVYASARRPETLEELRRLGCETLALDVTSEASMAAAVESVERREGAVGILVNNAGYQQSGAIEEVTRERWQRQFDTNVFGLVRLTQMVLPGMRRQGWGRIVNISSIGGTLTFPGGGAYHASKHALEAISDALRFEVRSFGIDVIVVQPGLIRTHFSDAAIHSLEAPGATSPYATLNESVAHTVRESYARGPVAFFAGTAEEVAQVIERAVKAKRPRTRYRASISAPLILGLRAILPDRLWDLFLRWKYKPPRPL